MHIKTPLDLGLMIREQRRRLGLSQAQLARDADVGRQWLVAVEQGKPGTELGLVLRTLAALGLILSVEQVQGVDPLPGSQGTVLDIDAVVAAARTDRA